MSDRPHPAARGVNRLLKLAIAAGSESAVRQHIARGDDLEWRDDRGFTPLMIAASRNRAGVCVLLMAAGVDRAVTDAAGRDALAIALDAGAGLAAEAISAFADEAGPGKNADRTEDRQEPTRTGAVLTSTAAPRAVQPEGASLKPCGEDRSGSSEGYGDWEEEEQLAPPQHDPAASRDQAAAQRAISDHVPIDDADDWTEVAAYLPETAAPLLRAEDAELQEALQSLLLRALREGSVPAHIVEQVYALGRGEHSQEFDADATLLRVINDLGAEVDERFEYASPFDDFRVETGAEANREEADAIADGLAELEASARRPKDPLRLQRKHTQRLPLLTRDEEIEIGKAMDLAVETCLDAMSAWPAGLYAVARIVDDVRAGRRLRTQIAGDGHDDVGGPSDPPVQAADISASIANIGDDLEEAGSELPRALPEAVETDAVDALEQLHALAAANGGSWPEPSVVRPVVSAINFRRSFLVELESQAGDDCSSAALAFRTAVLELRRHRDRMTVANLRLVFPEVKRYLFTGLPIEDLSQEGNLGLMRAVDRFDWRRGTRFATMAVPWISQAIGRAVANTALTIRLPAHVYEIASRFKREIAALEAALGREPTSSELAHRVGIPEPKFEQLWRCISDPLPLEGVEMALDLDMKRHSDQDAFAEAESRAIAKVLRNAVESLGKKSAGVIKLRYGFADVEPRTLEEVGKIYDVTRERVRQIEAKAILTLMHPARLATLASALGRDATLCRPSDDAVQQAHGDELDQAGQRKLGSLVAEAGSTKTTRIPFDQSQSADSRD
ncbi:sigma-70 family RNA polymerase sigma factor [Piscinibacter gummiphilus]|uniref:sigma-70 family RNA polymerase sigma factor n=1 Tax=Piscinibacter gummiphilus TaxID=946333 RepID=UPI000A26A95B|nr:sigma-70 family RNA polymerase sigma factor [Piscinibacter gummiphilus]ATU63332.1 hypothetical protein CPZ87_01535 [Piscinibacter gummiphilus]